MSSNSQLTNAIYQATSKFSKRMDEDGTIDPNITASWSAQLDSQTASIAASMCRNLASTTGEQLSDCKVSAKPGTLYRSDGGASITVTFSGSAKLDGQQTNLASVAKLVEHKG